MQNATELATDSSVDKAQPINSDGEEGENKEKNKLAIEAKSSEPTSLKDAVWDIVKPIATISFIATFVGAIALYIYLQRIGWPELLQPSLGSKAGIAVVFISLIVLFICLMGTMYGSAYWIGITADSYDAPSAIPQKLWLLVIGLHFIWLIFLEVTLISGDSVIGHWLADNFSTCVWAFFGIAISVSILCHWWARQNARDSLHQNGGATRNFWNKVSERFTEPVTLDGLLQKLKHIWKDAFRGLCLALGSLFASIGAITFVEINPSIGTRDITVLNSLIICAATLPGIVISVFYLVRYRASANLKDSLKTVVAVAMAMALFFCVWFPMNTLLPLQMLSLGAASVYSGTPHMYSLVKEESKASRKNKLVNFLLIGEAARSSIRRGSRPSLMPSRPVLRC